MTYQPDPTVHTSPDYEKRCVYCHPEILEAREKAKADEARKELDRRATVASFGGPLQPMPSPWVEYDPRKTSASNVMAQYQAAKQAQSAQEIAFRQVQQQQAAILGVYDTHLGGRHK